jgi:hypothetical protein
MKTPRLPRRPDTTTAAPRRRRALALFVALAAGSAAPVWAAGFGLPELMALLAQRKSGEARFTEERTVAGLEGPLRASGRLTFAAPDRFARFTEEPRAESMEVQGNSVLLKRGGRSRQMNLDAVPELAALADAMRGTLNGDAQALQKSFKAEVSGAPGKWVLTLKPSDARLAQQVRELQIAGTAGDVRSIDLQLRDGDRSLMLVQPLAAAASPAAPAAAK